jgi:WD40 repeat protein
VSPSADKPVRLWDLDTNLPFLQREDVVFNATISADGKLLATGCWDKNAYIWDIHIVLEEADLECLLFLPDASVDASAGMRDALQQMVQSISY